MARLRQEYLTGEHAKWSGLTEGWRKGDNGSLAEYLVKYGVWHQLALGERDKAERRLFDLGYMAALCGATDLVTSLRYWRVLGLTRADAGFLRVAADGEPDSLDASTVGIFLEESGLYQSAEALLRAALRIDGQQLGPEHPVTMMSANNLGTLLWAKGDYGGAEVMYRRALAGKEKAFGPQHPESLSSANNLGTLLSDKSHCEAAEELFSRALAGYERAFGPEHPDTLMVVGNLGNLLQDLNSTLFLLTTLSRQCLDLLLHPDSTGVSSTSGDSHV